MGSACNDLASALEYMLTIPGNIGAGFHELAERIDLVFDERDQQRRDPNLLVTILEKRATSTDLEDEARTTANKAAAGLKAMINVNIEVPDAIIDDALRIIDGRSDDSGLDEENGSNAGVSDSENDEEEDEDDLGVHRPVDAAIMEGLLTTKQGSKKRKKKGAQKAIRTTRPAAGEVLDYDVIVDVFKAEVHVHCEARAKKGRGHSIVVGRVASYWSKTYLDQITWAAAGHKRGRRPASSAFTPTAKQKELRAMLMKSGQNYRLKKIVDAKAINSGTKGPKSLAGLLTTLATRARVAPYMEWASDGPTYTADSNEYPLYGSDAESDVEDAKHVQRCNESTTSFAARRLRRPYPRMLKPKQQLTIAGARCEICEVLLLDCDEPYMGYKLRHLATGSIIESVVARGFVISPLPRLLILRSDVDSADLGPAPPAESSGVSNDGLKDENDLYVTGNGALDDVGLFTLATGHNGRGRNTVGAFTFEEPGDEEEGRNPFDASDVIPEAVQTDTKARKPRARKKPKLLSQNAGSGSGGSTGNGRGKQPRRPQPAPAWFPVKGDFLEVMCDYGADKGCTLTTAKVLVPNWSAKNELTMKFQAAPGAAGNGKYHELREQQVHIRFEEDGLDSIIGVDIRNYDCDEGDESRHFWRYCKFASSEKHRIASEAQEAAAERS